MESIIGLTFIESFIIINGIKLFILSEFILFLTIFLIYFNFRFNYNYYSLLLIYPLLSDYSFTIPISNLFILIYSSIPIQSIIIFIKIGLIISIFEGFGQCINCGLLFIILQIKEFYYSYFSLSDCIIGCIFYLTCGLHGIHIIFGCLLFLCFLLIISFPFYSYYIVINYSIYLYFNPDFFIEFTIGILFISYY